MDGSEPQESPVFAYPAFVIEPGSTHVFEAYAVGNDNIKSSETGTTGDYLFQLLPKAKPEFNSEEAKLQFTVNEEKQTIAAALPVLEGAEYSFDLNGEFSSEENAHIKTDCESDTEYTGYIRYAATTTHEASEAVPITGIAPRLAVQKPVASIPGGGTEFVGSTEVTLTTRTKDAVIYYTLDGSDPKDEANPERTCSLLRISPHTVQRTTKS